MLSKPKEDAEQRVERRLRIDLTHLSSGNGRFCAFLPLRRRVERLGLSPLPLFPKRSSLATPERTDPFRETPSGARTHRFARRAVNAKFQPLVLAKSEICDI